MNDISFSIGVYCDHLKEILDILYRKRRDEEEGRILELAYREIDRIISSVNKTDK